MKLRPETIAVRAGVDADPAHGAVMPPIYLSSNFSFEGLGRKRAYDYTRSGNPTRDELGRALAALEGGAGAAVTASGMAAVLLLLERLPAGARVLAPNGGYGGTWRLLAALERSGRLRVEWIDFHERESWERALRTPADLVWIETPTNPWLRMTDIAAVAAAAKRAGAAVAVDNTFPSPMRQRPIALGADFVVHSTTKYIAGHSDVVGGAVIAASPDAAADVAWWANCLGVTGAPFDAYLTLRGLRTLDVRLAAHERNARRVAECLCSHRAVVRVAYPGLASHPDRALAARQQSGFGGMVTFELAGGLAAVERFVDGLRVWTLAESLGGVESLIAHPATMTHASMSPEARARADIGDGLLRLSVGIEAAADLLGDLRAALGRAAGNCINRRPARATTPRRRVRARSGAAASGL